MEFWEETYITVFLQRPQHANREKKSVQLVEPLTTPVDSLVVKAAPVETEGILLRKEETPRTEEEIPTTDEILLIEKIPLIEEEESDQKVVAQATF